MELKFWLLDPSYTVVKEGPEVRLWGVAEDGRRVLVKDRGFRPYFYVLPKKGSDMGLVKSLILALSSSDAPILNVEPVQRRYLGSPVNVLKVTCLQPQSIPVYREKVKRIAQVEDVLEADVRFYIRYIIDNQVEPCGWHVVEVKEGEKRGLKVDAVYEALSPPRPLPPAPPPDLKILAFDIECYSETGTPKPQKDPVIIISIATGEGDREQFVASNSDDRGVLSDFISFIEEEDPDVIVGYNSNSYDWPYLVARAKKLGVKLNISREGTEPQPSVYGHYSVVGRAAVDLYNYAEELTEVKVKTLENVADYLKVIPKDARTIIEYTEIPKYWRNEALRRRLLKYAMEDAESTLGVAERVLPFLYQLSSLTGLPLDQVAAASVGFRVESHLMRHAFLEGELFPNRAEHPYSPYKGAIVLKPRPGIHENIAVIDFSAMYPHIMIKYNIGFDTYIPPGEASEEEFFEAPEVKHRFRKKPPSLYRKMLERLLEARAKIKEEIKDLDPSDPSYVILDNRQQAMKVLANASYGYLGWVGARFYMKPCAEATAAYGRQVILRANKIARYHGLDVIYSDTDSLFVKYVKGKVEEFIKHVEEEVGIELKIDKIYTVLFFTEAAKKYAGLLSDGKVDVVGFEAVRGDWCSLAQEVQTKVLELILRERSIQGAIRYVQEVVGMLRRREVPLKELIIWKSLTKSFEEYEVEAAHVAAAKRLMEAGFSLEVGDKVGFVIVKGASEKLADRAVPYVLVKPEEVDYEYYVTKQVIPSALRILKYFNVKEEELLIGRKQLSLFDFTS
ncbi:MAG: ribonuclease H-like domain-containing protein [Candidatus Nezhaarchaeota archaeon]|nr:ribonuclease H-like domain-containing protein [Candidatus Nezhaarchaeota archaeon]